MGSSSMQVAMAIGLPHDLYLISDCPMRVGTYLTVTTRSNATMPDLLTFVSVVAHE